MLRAASQNVDLFRLILLHLLVLDQPGWGSAAGGAGVEAGGTGGAWVEAGGAWVEAGEAGADSCHEVKTAYMMRQIGPVELVPDRPGTDPALRVCLPSGPGCCTSRMEDGYMTAVRSETQQKIRSFSFELKYLISGHTRAYQETVDSLVFFTSNLTSALFDSAYSALASDCQPLVLQLFRSLRLHLSGQADSSPDDAVRRFFSDLFPLVYRRLLNPGVGRASARLPPRPPPRRDDCLRLTQPDVGPFGPHPRLLAAGLTRALRHGRALSRLLGLAGDVLNATEKVALSRDCGRGLVRMQYCSHCRGLTLIRPCAGLCVNVMRGCLVAISELGAPWGRLVALLERLAATLATSSNHNSLELALLAVQSHVNDAVLHAQLHGPRITATVEKVCGPQAPQDPPAPPAPTSSTLHPATGSPHVTPHPPAGPRAPQRVQPQSHRSFPLKGSRGDKSLKKLSREFAASVQRYQWFFSELPEMLCESEMEVEQHTCWSGQDVVESYAARVVGGSLKAQRENPEVTVRSTDPVLKGVKQRLEQLVQDLLEELGWASRARTKSEEEEEGGSRARTKSEEEEEGGSTLTHGSGGGGGDDCDDDEDGCGASGDETDDASSGRQPGGKDVAPPPPPARGPAPPRHNSPPVSVRGSAHTTTMEPLAAVTLLLLLVLPWKPR